MTDLTSATSQSTNGRISIDLDTPPTNGEQSAWINPDPGQLELPLDPPLREITESAALEEATPPTKVDRKPLDWRGFFDREAKWVRIAGIVAAVLTLLLVIAFSFAYRELNSALMLAQKPNADGKVRTLIGGWTDYVAEPPHQYFGGRGQVLMVLTGETTEDDDKYTGLTDTIMVCLLDFNYNRVKVISIPRDTIVHYGRRWGRINEAASINADVNALGEKVGEFVTVPIDNVVSVNYDGFRDIIDALGGVEVEVPKRMKYTDRAGGLSIDFEPGPQRLNGQHALEYARFRHDAEGDFGRIRRQQQLITELKRQKLNIGIVSSLPQLIPAMQRAVSTSKELSYEQMRALMGFIAGLERENIEFATLPTYGQMHYGASVQVPRYDETRDLLTRFFSEEPLTPVGPPAPATDEDTSTL